GVSGDIAPASRNALITCCAGRDDARTVARMVRARSAQAWAIARRDGLLRNMVVATPLPPNGARLSCGRNARGRKAVKRQKTRLAGEATQFFPQERPAASSAC